MIKTKEEKKERCPLDKGHTPNKETIESIQLSEKGEGISRFNSMEDLFKDLGM